ncbi:uncharacterized protein LOC132739201 [Ruditapes philippinarum]|uniref:uncharacterized protein LOC132739201 n=1 Tax=Ruditapes philippinarum TaxID=129788 RepID=UPI00295B8E07|nr:uncharacterized protein LOC132739201 [Ruditapes philippinarum]
MKIGILILTVFAIGVAEEKPGYCPAIRKAVTTEASGLECVTDFVCNGTDKCCGSKCTRPECGADSKETRCPIDLCTFFTCSNIPDAECFSNPCSCKRLWLTKHRDVTLECDESDANGDGEVNSVKSDEDDYNEDKVKDNENGQEM